MVISASTTACVTSRDDRVLPAGWFAAQLLLGSRNRENHMGATTYHDVQFRQHAVEGHHHGRPEQRVGQGSAGLVLDLVNMFDPQYDLPGRYMYMQYKQKF